MNKLNTIWLIIFTIMPLVACGKEAEQPYLFVENTPLNEEEQKSIYRISVDGSDIDHIHDFGERTLYWFSPDFRYLAFAKTDDRSELILTVMDVQTNQMVAQIPDITPYLRQDSVLWDPTSSKLLFDKTPSDRESIIDWGIYDVIEISV